MRMEIEDRKFVEDLEIDTIFFYILRNRRKSIFRAQKTERESKERVLKKAKDKL